MNEFEQRAVEDLDEIERLSDEALTYFRAGKRPELQAKLDQINEIASEWQ